MVLECSELYSVEPELLERLWSGCGQAIYSLEARERQLGLGEEVKNIYSFWLFMDTVFSHSPGHQHLLFHKLHHFRC